MWGNILSHLGMHHTIDGYHMILNQRNKNVTCHKKHTFDFICYHGRQMPSVKDSDFGIGRVCKLHAVTQNNETYQNQRNCCER
jgi:hypothetical protein